MAKVDVEVAPFSLVVPDIAVDGLVADFHQAISFETPCNLLRTPLAPNELLHECPVSLRKLLISARDRSPGPGSSNRLAGAVGTVVTGVAADLAPDRGPAAANPFGHLRDRQALFSEGRDDYPLFRGDLEILHCDVPNLAGKGSIALSQITSLFSLGVALSI